MVNLANVYASLRRSYGENFMITYAAAPTYLRQIVGPNESMGKIIYLYEEDRIKMKFINFDSPTKVKKSENELDLTGSPLKDDCVVDAIADVSIEMQEDSLNPWSPDEEFHKGILLGKARSIFCENSFQRGEAACDAKGSVWILCSGADAENTILFQYEFKCGFNSRGLITFLGIVPTLHVNARDILKHHYSLSRPHTKIETLIENTYRINSNILIRCSWSTTAAIPTLINLSSCDVTLSQSFRLMDCTPSTEEFMNQLRILKFIRDDILAYKDEVAQGCNGSSVGKEPIYRCGRGIDIEDLREDVSKVMNELSGFAEIDDGSGSEFDIEAVVQRAKLRRLTDLTDKLWNLLKCCSSYKDLKMAFNVVFQCAAKCNIVNTPTNKNRLAEIITEVANRRLAIPCLSGTEPLELLLEIGIEKLYKDYEFIFTESKICRAIDLKNKTTTEEVKGNDAPLNVRKSIRNAMRPETSAGSRKTLLHSNIKNTAKVDNVDIVSFKNSNFNANESNIQLAKLLQIHCTLEHLLMLQIYLNIRNVYSDVCEQLLQKPVRIVNSIDESLLDEISITLSPHDVREHLEGKEPHAMRVIMKSNNKFRYTKTTCFYCMENICPPGVSNCFQTEGKEYDKNNFYYCWLYRKIKTVCQTKSAEQ